jgi:hypothetical protein
MQFCQYLEPNEFTFEINAYIDSSGQFYLAIFAGLQGVSAKQYYNVNPAFTGSMVSVAPKAITSASVKVENN